MAKSGKKRSYLFHLVFLLSCLSHLSIFSYPDSKILDVLWNKREDIENQNKILEFIVKGESIPQNFDIAWRVARLVYFAGNFGVGYNSFKKEKKMEIFKYGFEAADIARKTNPNRVEGYYWYSVNLGSYGLAKGIFSALNYAEEARDSLLKAAELDPTYHFGGPYRMLGLFYQEAPSFISFGDKKKAEEYFNKAIEVAPNYRLNTMDLSTLKKQQGKREVALELLKKAKLKPNVDGNFEETRYLKELEKNLRILNEEEG